MVNMETKFLSFELLYLFLKYMLSEFMENCILVDVHLGGKNWIFLPLGYRWAFNKAGVELIISFV